MRCTLWLYLVGAKIKRVTVYNILKTLDYKILHRARICRLYCSLQSFEQSFNYINRISKYILAPLKSIVLLRAEMLVRTGNVLSCHSLWKQSVPGQTSPLKRQTCTFSVEETVINVHSLANQIQMDLFCNGKDIYHKSK